MAKLMNIILVNLSKNWGGGEKWFFTVGKKLKEKGHKVTWLVYPNSELERRLQAHELPFDAMPVPLGSLFNYRKLRHTKRWPK